jgi:diguanylate cyclase (GGDEF)-like protein/PAS domain S-box-containing protein
MSTRERIREWLTRRSVCVAAGCLPVLILCVLAVSSERHWQQRAVAFQRDNLNLQLERLAREVARESDELIERARDLGESELIAHLAEDDAGVAPDRTALVSLTRRSVDALLVVSASQTVRFSAKIGGDQLIEEPPVPAAMRFLASAAAAASALRSSEDVRSLAPATGFAEDQWIVARPIISRASPAALLGWVVVTRSLSPAVIARLARSVSGSLIAHPLRAFDAASLPESLLRPAANGAAGNLDVTTHLSLDHSSGYAALRDANGLAVWVFRLGVAAPSPAPAADDGGGIQLGYVVGAALLLAAIAVVALVALKRYVRRQKSVDARYKAIIDQANDGIVIVDAQTEKVVYSNPAFLSRLGYTHAEALALTLRDIFADGAAAPESVLTRLRDTNSQMALSIQLRCKSGSCIDVEVRCNALDADGRDALAYVTQDVSVRKKAEQQLIENQHRLDRMAHHDQLTGLPNRHYLTAFLPDAIAEAQAANTMLGVVFLDLDRFKHINDTRGHETGDKLLQEVATRLRAVVRDADVVIRMGGDEFVVVFRHVEAYDEVTLGAARIIETLNQPIVIDEHPLQTTGSVGVSLFPRDGSNMVELLKHSDTAMYQAKDRGRNNVQMFSPVMNRKLKHRVAVEASLREALRLKQLDVHYQPFINLLTRKVVGLEALMRWHHPDHGMVPADQFIPVAEETGLIVPMGNFVLHRTLQNMSAWRKAGARLVPMSLNIAPAQLQRGELQSTIATLLKTHGLRPEMLQLEMTERAMFDSHVPAGENRQDTMARLRDLGVKIAIDDFGTGYSSLSYLKHWRVDALKIDRSFVRDLVTDSSDLAIVSAIIAIARHLQIQVIAEGIEGYQQAEILRRLGCAVGQGFLFARPMPADQCLKLLRENADPDKAEDEDMLAVFSAGRG